MIRYMIYDMIWNDMMMWCDVILCYIILFCIILYYYIKIVWDHCRICGPSLTETLISGAYLYIQHTFQLHLHSTIWLDWVGMPSKCRHKTLCAVGPRTLFDCVDWTLSTKNNIKMCHKRGKVKGKVYPRTDHEGTEG